VVVAKYGHTVVERNRLRRQLRELVRLFLIPRLPGVDLLIRALPSAYSVGFKELAVEINWIQVQLITSMPAK
jgi:ribonuclease P protein component